MARACMALAQSGSFFAFFSNFSKFTIQKLSEVQGAGVSRQVNQFFRE